MAKVTKACPFSNRSCRECAIYLGRHAQLCIAARYQNGHLPKPKLTYGCTHLKFEFPDELASSEKLNKDIEDREENVNEVKIVWK